MPVRPFTPFDAIRLHDGTWKYLYKDANANTYKSHHSYKTESNAEVNATAFCALPESLLSSCNIPVTPTTLQIINKALNHAAMVTATDPNQKFELAKAVFGADYIFYFMVKSNNTVTTVSLDQDLPPWPNMELDGPYQSLGHY